jgi:outer membrane protein insertion porin family
VFADVQADPRFLEEPGQLDLVYRVKEGDVFRVGEVNVHIAGEFPHTRDSVVLNRMSLRPGDIIDMREIRASERRLKASQLFETNPAEGEAPKIIVRPPGLNAVGGVASVTAQNTAIRGQSPDSEEPKQYYQPRPEIGQYPAAPASVATSGQQGPSTLYSWEGPRQPPAVAMPSVPPQYTHPQAQPYRAPSGGY